MSPIYDLAEARKLKAYGTGKKTPEEILAFHEEMLRSQGFPLCFLCDEPWTDDHPKDCADWPEVGS